MKIVIWGGLSDGKLISKIDPLVNNPRISTIYLYRYNGNPYNGTKINKIEYFGFKTKHNKTYTFFAFIHLVYLAAIKRPDILVGIYYYPYGFLVSIISNLFSIKDIQVLPGSDLNRIEQSKLLLYFFTKSFRIGVRGKKSSERVANLGVPFERIFVLNNVFNYAQFLQESKMLVEGQKQCDLIFVGYFRREKRLDKLLEIVLELKKTKYDISCLMVGDGQEKENIRNMINQFKLSENVFLRDYDFDIAKWYKYGRVFILTSEVEGLNMSMIEAMTLGIPAIVPKINDLEEVVINGVNGFLINAKSEISEYVDRIVTILENDEVYTNLSVNAKNLIVTLAERSYSEEAISKVWQRIISEV